MGAFASTDLPYAWPEPGRFAPLDPDAALAPAWTAWGGRATIKLNPDLLGPHGTKVSVQNGGTQGKDGGLRFSMHEQGGMSFKVGGTQFQGFVDGNLQLRGDLRFEHKGKMLLLSDLKVVPRPSDTWQIDLVAADGTVWFTNAQVHYQLSPDRTKIAMFNMELRMTKAFSDWMGEPQLNGETIGSMAIDSSVRVDGDQSKSAKTCTSPNWPNSGGGAWLADVSLIAMSSIVYKRCSGTCTGQPTGTGLAVFSPNSELRNSTASNAAEVPWYAKFTGYRPPYNNDQHPYLIWNLYRVDQNGRVDHIGRSGVKHAFLTTNVQCSDATCGSVSGAILGKGCRDVYSSGNNDQGSALGPRREIVPAKGLWGRCGSIYDALPCDNINDSPGDPNQLRDRMLVLESEINSTNYPNATYYFESWYIVRDDVDIYNTMGYRRVIPTFNTVWQMPSTGAFVTGPFIDTWAPPTAAGNVKNVEIASPDGQARVAVKAVYTGNGIWRYDYAVMNFSFSRESKALVPVAGQPNAEVYRVDRNFGFSAFQVQSDAQAAPVNLRFSDGDTNAGNQWSSVIGANNVRWTGVESSALNWGTLYSFSLESELAPGPASASVEVLDAGSPSAFTVNVIGATGVMGGLFRDGVE